MKKIIIIFSFIITLTFIIYKANANNLIDYMSIGDSFDLGINSYGNNTYSYRDYLKNYLNNNNLLHNTSFYYSKTNYKIEDLLNDIKINKEIIYNDKTYNIKKELREADLITIAIGLDELVSIIETDNITSNIYIKVDKFIKNMEELVNNIQKISSSNIILIGYYNPYLNGNKDLERLFAYINDEYVKIAKRYNITYVDIYNIITSDYLPNSKDYHLNSKGYLKIASKIIEELKL